MDSAQDPVVQTLEMLSQLAMLVYPQVQVAIIVMALFGAYAVLSIAALWSLLQRRRKNWILLSALGVTAAATILHSSLLIALPLAQIKALLMRPSNISLVERYIDLENSQLQKISYPTMIIVGGSADAGLVFLVNNALAVWRAVSVWSSSSRSIVSLVLYSLLAANVGLYPPLIYMTVQQSQDLASSSSGYFSSDMTLFALVTAQSSVSILVNALATGIIAYKAYEHRIFESRAGTRLFGAKVLLLLTESGLFYIMIQIVRLVLVCLLVLPAFKNDPAQWLEVGKATMIFQFSSAIVCAMYPPALTLIINYCYTTHNTMHNTSPPSTFLPMQAPSPSLSRTYTHEADPLSSVVSIIPSSYYSEQQLVDRSLDYRLGHGGTGKRTYPQPVAF